MTRIFLDSNILLYTLEQQERGRLARHAMRDSYAISVQVLNEFANVVRKKRLLNDEELQRAELRFRRLLLVVPITIELHDSALLLAARYKFNFYDALIVAAALDTDCDVLYSEDMQHGQTIEGRLQVVNPFR